MTEPKQFICSFLGIPETGFAEVVINSKLMCDLLEAWDESKSKNEFGQPMFHPATNDIQEAYIRFEKEKAKNNPIVMGGNRDSEGNGLVDAVTKYPNLLNATKADITTNDLQKDYNRPRNWINPLED